MNSPHLPPSYLLDSERTQSAEDIARQLALAFAATAAERDHRGGTPKMERDALRASGLLRLAIPAEFGGAGGDWPTVMRTVRLLATSDSSVAHVYAFHHLMLATVRLFSRPEQWQPWYEHTAAHDWFWGNALNPLDERTVARRCNGWREFSGRKSFCSGALDSEMLIASALDQDTRQLLVAAVPTLRSGITVLADWDNIGQRQTDSGSVDFERVRVEEHEILADPGPLSTPFSCLRPLLAQLILANIYLGIAEGAYSDARYYTLNEARAWHRAQVDQPWQDPYVLNHYGEFWAGLEGVRCLIERAAEHFDAAWRQGEALNEAGRGEVALAIAAAKVAATRVGLDVTSRMFEVTGARSTHAGLRLDRHWRNLRTHSLHDPVDYKLRELGEWALLQHYPTPSFYS
ncbi:acyl-CoA dehydrogenase family protein [Chitinolyticbacter meiyuanensis]|uniref:acyl-CoA dehydrogenase family protein n=1 Tax=Chitinolyticbacter meiyuanensis TaxID=682798 RepID=UPI001C9E960D|nr:acyl-CoA dehydrogenase family protein [Chitinolyticbacter meiyuanensis]